MSNEPIAPETNGVAVKLLATVDLGPEIEGMAGRLLRMRMVTIEPGGVLRTDSRPYRQTGHRLHPARNDHRSSERSRNRLWAGSWLARGQEHETLAREQRKRSGG